MFTTYLLLGVWFAIIVILIGSYFLYPILIHFLPNNTNSEPPQIKDDTVIHLIIPCYNEESVIEEKIHNSFKIKSHLKLRVYVVIDKSDDSTYEKAFALKSKYENLNVVNKGYRKGKNDSINFIVDDIKPNDHDLLFFTDSNTFFNEDVVEQFLPEFYKGSVLVGGSMKYIDQETKSAKAEGLYWKYEEWIRRNESKLGRLIAMNGGIIVLLARYFDHIPLYVPNDFEAPLRLASEHRVTFSKNAIGFESAIIDSQEEFKRKRRMANRQMNAVIYHWDKMSFIIRLQTIFHKIIRWFGLQLFIIQALIGYILSLEFALFKYVGYFNLTLLILLLISIPLKKAKFFSTIFHASAVHHYGFLGAFGSIIGKKVNIWSKAETNRK